MYHTNVKKPVTIFKSTDSGMPTFSDTLIPILKHCLNLSGWTTEHEDATTCVLKSVDGIYLHLTDDNGMQLKPTLRTDVTNLTDGTIIASCNTEFKYKYTGETSGEFVIVACDSTFIFLQEMPKYYTGNNLPDNRQGIYFYGGKAGKNTTGNNGYVLHHTGGSWDTNDMERSGILISHVNSKHEDSGGYVQPHVYNNISSASFLYCTFDGQTEYTPNQFISGVYVTHDSTELHYLPMIYKPSSTNNLTNRLVVTSNNRKFMAHATATRDINFILVPIDFWEL